MKSRRETILDIRFRRLIESMELYGLSETKSGKGFLNPWVTGLLLSSALMDEIRREAPYNAHVTWGQILNPDDTLSGEIDIIVHIGKPLYQWRSIGYSIIRRQTVLSLYEVKRTFSMYDKHEADYSRLRKFATDVYLIIYGTHTSIENIRKREAKLKEIGYKDVFHLVRWTKREPTGAAEPVYENWYRLMKAARTL